jgi:tetratricopeptide (TPR) repeat protein
MTGRRPRVAVLVAVALAVAVTGFVVTGLTTHGDGSDGSGRPAPPSPPTSGAADALSRAIAQQQARLRASPGDYSGWAALGAAYVQQARVTADPSYYPKAEGALRRSLALNTAANDGAMTGMGSLENARHDFAAARSWARRALTINASSAPAYGVLGDALTQLGDAAGATAAIQRMVDLKPGVGSFARASYDLEQRGDVANARALLTRALADATDRSDLAFCHQYLGELAFNNGDPGSAAHEYALGLVADPSYTPLLEGKAKAEAALGRTADAVRDYTTLVDTVPQPQYVVELGELLQATGQRAAADAEYALLATELRLFAAAGVTDDLTPAEFYADHGDPPGALAHARAEWGRRKNVLVADALAWALHANGRDAEALPYARAATRFGWRNALFAYHRGMIENALGQRSAARADLAAALAVNPHFNPLAAPIARRTVDGLAIHLRGRGSAAPPEAMVAGSLGGRR